MSKSKLAMAGVGVIEGRGQKFLLLSSNHVPIFRERHFSCWAHRSLRAYKCRLGFSQDRKAFSVRMLRAAVYWETKNMSTGTVKWFNVTKGFGFIQPTDGSKDVFVHASAVERSSLGQLKEGDKVSYDLERGQQGKTSAVNLQAA